MGSSTATHAAEKKSLDTIHKGEKKVEELYIAQKSNFEYGPMKRIKTFSETHPEVMKEWIKKFNWKALLDYTGDKFPDRELFKHEKLKYRIVTWLEQNIVGGRELGGFRNYNLIKV